MAEEPFLINPPKRLRRRRNPIGETLVTIGANPTRRNPMRRRIRRNPDNPWYGDPGGHRIAALMRWGKIPRGHIRRHRKRGRPSVHTRRVVHHRRKRVVHRRRRWAPAHVRYRRKVAQQAFWATKYGHMLAHPRSHKVYTRKGFITMRHRKHRRHRSRRNTWFGQPRRHRSAAKLGWRRGHRIGGRRVRRRNYFTNPLEATHTNPRRRHHRRHNVRHHRRHRRNPATLGFGRFTSDIMNVREWAPLAITGGLSAVVGAVSPSMLGVENQWAKLGVQTAVAIGGGLVVERFVDKRHGQAWMIVGVAMVGYQLLKQFVFVPYFPQFAVGLGDYRSYYPVSAYANQDEVSQQVGAFTNMQAFPNAMHDYPGVDGVGAYPYDGAGY